MFARLRSLAPAVLLATALSGAAAGGAVLAHVATDHATGSGHAHHRDAHDHAAHHAAGSGADHGRASHEPVHDPAHEPGSKPAHDPAHEHEIASMAATAHARIACPGPDAQPCLAEAGHDLFDRPARGALRHPVPPVPGAGPPGTQRHSILLL